MRFQLLPVIVVAFFSACGSVMPSISLDAGPFDAGSVSTGDAGLTVVTDAGADAGPEVDAGLALADAGHEVDAGLALADAGHEVDAGLALADAGAEAFADAGTSASDAGLDAGEFSPLDAGLFCQPGATQACSSLDGGTSVFAPCHAGLRTCNGAGSAWGACVGEVTPSAEVCGNGLDEDCNGVADDSLDEDGDGFTVCEGDCCDAPSCTGAVSINPGAFEVLGNSLDDDCNQAVDESISCDQGLQLASGDAFDAVKALDLCSAADAGRRWGVVAARYRSTSSDAGIQNLTHGLMQGFGSGVSPQFGSAMVVLSTGVARVPGQPDFSSSMSFDHSLTDTGPSDWVLNGGPATAGESNCGPPSTCSAATCTVHDPVMLELTVRVPTNAHAVQGRFAFYSKDYPESLCGGFADQFVVLLSSGASTNPGHHNISLLNGVTIGADNRLLFDQCINGATGCVSGVAGNQTTCIGTTGLSGTGFDAVAMNQCDTNSLLGGGTSWLAFAGNVVPGELARLRFALWDSGDGSEDSTVLIDHLHWLTAPVTAGASYEVQRATIR